MSCEYEYNNSSRFTQSDVLTEFIAVFDQCCANRSSDGSKEDEVPVTILVERIASTIKIPYSSRNYHDLENLMRDVLSSTKNNIEENLSKVEFVRRISKFLENLNDINSNFDVSKTEQFSNSFNNSINCSTSDLSEDKGANDSYINSLLKEKNTLENVITNLRESNKTLERTNAREKLEKKSLQLSLNEAAERETELESKILHLRNELKRSNAQSKEKSNEKLLILEKEKFLVLEKEMDNSRKELSLVKQNLADCKFENEQYRAKNLELVKELDCMHYSNESSLKNMELCQSQLMSLKEQLDAVNLLKQEVEEQLKSSMHQNHQMTLLNQDLEAENIMLKNEKHKEETLISPLFNRNSVNSEGYQIFTSTPIATKQKVALKKILSTQVSLKEELEAEDEVHFDKYGSYFGGKPTTPRPEIVEIVGKQQSLIIGLVDKINNQCAGSGMGRNNDEIRNINQEDKKNAISQTDKIIEFPHTNSNAFVCNGDTITELSEKRDTQKLAHFRSSGLVNDSKSEKDTPTSATVSSLYIGNSSTDSIAVDFQECSSFKASSPCSIQPKENFASAVHLSNISSINDVTTTDSSVNEAFVTANISCDFDIDDDEDDNIAGKAIAEDVMQMYMLPTKSPLKEGRKSTDIGKNNSGRDIFKALLKIAKVVLLVLSVLFRACVVIIFATISLLISLYYMNHHGLLFRAGNACNAPSCYYTLEELLQPLIEVRWNGRPPV